MCAQLHSFQKPSRMMLLELSLLFPSWHHTSKAHVWAHLKNPLMYLFAWCLKETLQFGPTQSTLWELVSFVLLTTSINNLNFASSTSTCSRQSEQKHCHLLSIINTHTRCNQSKIHLSSLKEIKWVGLSWSKVSIVQTPECQVVTWGSPLCHEETNVCTVRFFSV